MKAGLRGSANNSDLFEEAFRWDQHLHALCFRESFRNGIKQANPTLAELCKQTGGSYTYVERFNLLKTCIELLATSCTTTVGMRVTTPDKQTNLVQFYFNINSKIKKPQIQNANQQIQLPQ